jgi:DNA-binding transcriptional ArsR family regulator
MSDAELAEHVAAKLKSIANQIDDLQKLKAKLEDLQQHLGTNPGNESVAPQLPEVGTETAKSATVPAARRTNAAAAKPQSKKATAKATGGTKKLRAAKRVGGKAQRKSPTRVDLLLELLSEQPRTVAELTQLLKQEHPSHAARDTVVRNTLENSLVAKGLTHRSRQGRNVFYSTPASESSAEAQEADAVDVNKEAAPAPA